MANRKDIRECLVIKKRHFLFWNWLDKYYIHDWVYLSKTKRKCERCDLKEMFFGMTGNGDFIEEDWRRCK